MLQLTLLCATAADGGGTFAPAVVALAFPDSIPQTVTRLPRSQNQDHWIQDTPSRLGGDDSIRRSGRAQGALSWALAEASYRHCPLHIVHAGGSMSSDSYAAAESLLVEAESHVRRAAPGTGVVAEVFVGDPAPMLLSRAQGAALAVVGSRGAGGLRGLQVGSVSAALAAEAPCPVIVVRPHRKGTAFRASPRGQVVVGVDGPEMSTEAVRFALHEAARRHVGVIAVHASMSPRPHPTYEHLRVSGIPLSHQVRAQRPSTGTHR
ncbi:universal stress protein [Kribbella sp. NPDC000426]|uniref:universal stress protein n=1 Tax=Kribbella sp. NPDC000426 TaxID=3154255 RepID=UPI0033283DEC